ncbi:hypothetical protein, partial [Paraburkholderia azotifigens]|uniref:hypothetical protein n=1 Tax=Paraburkholderia azotifigens TaxID=2057004 RepID=UPI0038BCE714
MGGTRRWSGLNGHCAVQRGKGARLLFLVLGWSLVALVARALPFGFCGLCAGIRGLLFHWHPRDVIGL